MGHEIYDIGITALNELIHSRGLRNDSHKPYDVGDYILVVGTMSFGASSIEVIYIDRVGSKPDTFYHYEDGFVNDYLNEYDILIEPYVYTHEIWHVVNDVDVYDLPVIVYPPANFFGSHIRDRFLLCAQITAAEDEIMDIDEDVMCCCTSDIKKLIAYLLRNNISKHVYDDNYNYSYYVRYHTNKYYSERRMTLRELVANA